MAKCESCKNKKELREEMYESTKLVDNWVVWFAVIWSGLAIYGLYSLIVKII